MNSITWLAFWFSNLVLVRNLQTKIPMIDESLPECDLRRSSLFCDFQDSSIDTIYLENGNETVGIIYVYNIAELHLNQPICTNLALNNIGRVEITETELDSCSRTIKLTAKDTLLTKIPRNTKEIDLENCTLLSLTSVSSLTKASILNSHIEVLDIPEPSINAASFTVDGSSIGMLQKLVLNGSGFSMKSTKIDLISPGGLVVKHGLAKLENCSLKNVSADSFWIYPNATLMLENISGNIRISHTGKTSDGRLFVVENTADQNDFFTGFVVTLSAFVITMVSCLGIIFVHFIKERSRRRVTVIKGQTDQFNAENEAKSQNRDEQITLLDKNFPSEQTRSIETLGKHQETEILTNSLVDDRHLPTYTSNSNGGDVALTKEQLTPPYHQSPDNLSDKVIIFKFYSLTEQEFDIEDVWKRDKIKIVRKESTYDWEEIKEKLSRKRYLSEFQVIQVTATEFHSIRNGATLSTLSKRIRAIILDHEGAVKVKEDDDPLIKKQFSVPPNNQSLPENEGPLKGGDSTEKQLSSPPYYQSQPAHEGAVKERDSILTEKQLSLPPHYQSQPAHDGAVKESDSALTKDQLPVSPYPHSPDNLSDKVIIFKSFSLAGQESDLTDALKNGKIRIVLKENTYDWKEIEKELLSSKRNLSEFQVMLATTTEFSFIQNGETLSALTKKVPAILAKVQSKSDLPTPVKRAPSVPPGISSAELQPAGNPSNSKYPELLRYWNTKVVIGTNNQLLAKPEGSQDEGKFLSEED